MALKAPNTVCKNRNCTKGKDGGRKVFYSCKYCVHTVSKQSVACCDECYEEYLVQVTKARESGNPLTFEEKLPERTDMTVEEVFELVMETPTEVVVEETEQELAEELAEEPHHSYGRAVKKINEKIDENEEEGDA